MKNKNIRKAVAFMSALTMAAAAVSTPVNSVKNVNAGEVLGETDFNCKALPWHTVESSPAKQLFELDKDGAFHVMILKAEGADREKWDLQFRHRKLNFKAGHEYTVSFKAKASREGLELSSKIATIRADEEYFVLNRDGSMTQGPHMGGQWGSALKLTEDWQEITGTFKPTRDIEDAEWNFQYAKGTMYEGNAVDGDEIWFDDMSVFCNTCDECCNSYDSDLGMVNRNNSGLENNFISVNQLGYFPKLRKIAVLGDNQGEMYPGTPKIEFEKKSYKFELVDKSGKTVYEGTSGPAIKDKDSGDTVYKLDFTEFKTPGTYYIRVGDWRSLEFRIGDDIYYGENSNLLTDAVNYFYQSRSGTAIEAKYITSGKQSRLALPSTYAVDIGDIQTEWHNEYAKNEDATQTYKSSKQVVNGGWYDAEDHGKYVVNSGISLWTLQNMYERTIYNGTEYKKFNDGSGIVSVPETDNKIPDILDEAAYELDWMASMIVKEDEPAWGEYAGMVYHSVQDVTPIGIGYKMPDYECEDHHVPRIIKPPTFAATLNFAACAAQAARLWEPYDSEKAADYLSKAKAAYEAYEKNYYPADYTTTTHPELGCECVKEELNKKSLYAPAWHTKSGNAYGDFDVKDEAYWAACELYVTTELMKDSDAKKYLKILSSDKENAFNVKTTITSAERVILPSAFDWKNTASAGSLTLALHKDLLSEEQIDQLSKSISQAADAYIKLEDEQGYGLPLTESDTLYSTQSMIYPDAYLSGYDFNSNNMVLNNALVTAYACDQSATEKDQFKYLSGVSGAMDYLLGTNPLSFSYITGYGSYTVKNPVQRFWANELDSDFPAAPDGVLSSGPNAGVQDPYMRLLGFVPEQKENISQRCYADSVESWSTNQSGLTLNASLAWVVSFLEDAAAPIRVTPDDNQTDKTEKPDDKDEPDVQAPDKKDDSDVQAPDKKDDSDVKDPDKNDNSAVKDPDKNDDSAVKDPDKNDNSAVQNPDKKDENSVLLGDVNNDGKIDITDLSELALSLIGEKELAHSKNADVDKDGKVKLADLARIRQYLSHVIEAF